MAEAILEKLSGPDRCEGEISCSVNPENQNLDEGGAAQPPIMAENGSGQNVDRRRNEYRSACQLEFPIFNGIDTDGWLFPIERYFSLNQLTEAENLESVAMRGRTWFEYAEEGRKFTNRRSFKD